MRTFLSIGIAAAIGFFLLTGDALAYDMEYYTYGGFLAITTALEKIVLIFSDNGFSGLMATFAIAGAFTGIISTYYALIKGARVSPLGWVIPFLLGAMIYLTCVVPKATLTVYDPVSNQFKSIQNLPQGIVLVAGYLNLIERGIVDIVHTSSDPGSYQLSASGAGFSAILQAVSGNRSVMDSYFEQSFRAYLRDCVFFDMSMPNGLVNTNALMSGTADLATELGKADNPAVFTVWYDEDDKGGTTMNCRDAWTLLNEGYNDVSNMEGALKDVCARSGYNPGDAAQLQQCNTNLSQFISTVAYKGDVSIGQLEQYLRQVDMANGLQMALTEANPDAAVKAFSAQNLQQGGVAMGLIAHEWLPVMRAVFTAITFGIMPFVLIFIFFPEAGLKAVMLVVGMFVWLTFWGIMDAVVHGIATDYAARTFEGIRSARMGFTAIINTPGACEKALGIFGFAQTASIMLATAFTGVLVKFGGHALSMMAGNIMGSMQTSAGHGAAVAIRPDTAAREYDALLQSIPTMANAHKFDFGSRAMWMTSDSVARTGAGMDAHGEYGPSSYQDVKGFSARRDFEGQKVDMDRFKTEVPGASYDGAAKAAGAGHESRFGMDGRMVTIHPTGTATGEEKRGDYTFGESVGTGGERSYFYNGVPGSATLDGEGRFAKVDLARWKVSAGDLMRARASSEVAQTLAEQTSYDRAFQSSEKLSEYLGIENRIGREYQDRLQGNLKREVGSDRDISNIKAENSKEAISLGTALKGGSQIKGIGASADGGWRIATENDQGKRLTFNVTQSEKNAWDQAWSRAKSQSLSDILSRKGGREDIIATAERSSNSSLRQIASRYNEEKGFLGRIDENLAIAAANEVAGKPGFGAIKDPGERTDRVMKYLSTDQGYEALKGVLDRRTEAAREGIKAGRPIDGARPEEIEADVRSRWEDAAGERAHHVNEVSKRVQEGQAMLGKKLMFNNDHYGTGGKIRHEVGQVNRKTGGVIQQYNEERDKMNTPREKIQEKVADLVTPKPIPGAVDLSGRPYDGNGEK
jgi:conjugal transfer mating pair stabilization protein TraG